MIETGSPELAEAIRRATPERVQDPRGFDAIVVGAGAAGGWAAMLLTEGGLSVLLLDAGWRTSFWSAPVRGATAAMVRGAARPELQAILPDPVVRLGRKALKAAGKLRQPVQTRCFAWELAPDAFVDDRDNPYVLDPGVRFDWFRARQIGGKMTIPGHGRQYYRLGARDLVPQDDLSPRWPVSAEELAGLYDAVEARLGLSGGDEDCEWIPGCRPAARVSPTAAETATVATLKARWPDAPSILGRSAPPLDSVGLAAATGRLTCRQGAAAGRVQVDAGGRVSGVTWIDRASRAEMSARAPLVFLCASALESTRILLASRDGTGEAIGRRSDRLGRGLMDHVVLSAEGTGGALEGEPEPLVPGRCVYLPRFDLSLDGEPAARGFGVQLYRWSAGRGRSLFTGVCFAEMTPRPDNRVVLDPERKDSLGLPVLRIACRHSPGELARASRQSAALAEIAQTLGVKLHRLDVEPNPPGSALHECGTARMGDDPGSSVLDPFCQCWDAQGLFVTDGAAFPSQGAQNPTLTILALTARACAKAIGAEMAAGATAAWAIPPAQAGSAAWVR